MPKKLSDLTAKALGPGREVPKSFIADVVSKFKNQTKKRKRNDLPTTPAHPIGTNDSKSCWFSYSELEQLFNDNGLPPNATANEKMKFGLRIYFGMHDKDHVFHQPPTGVPLPAGYDEQHTVVLVTTLKDTQIPTKNNDLLIDGTSSISYALDGMDIGSLCPPACDGGETWK